MSKHLLPTGSTPLEKAAADALKGVDLLSVPLRTLQNPWTCPAPLLPWLAWAYSVDRWDDNWPEITRRQTIAASYDVHRKKGTPGAIRRIVSSVGYLATLSEWWEFGGEPGTFRLAIGVPESGSPDEVQREIVRLIDDVRPLSRHLARIDIIQESPGAVFVGSATMDGDIITVYPLEESWELPLQPESDISLSSRIEV
ncbi:phage tail protein I [Salmonella enterica]|nr:phage tail protein I [Salmonella enterica]EFR3656692.1 phage tail protein I [Salmonella enterica]EJN0489494.1 phage tail protein I [Salmonella enterica]